MDVQTSRRGFLSNCLTTMTEAKSLPVNPCSRAVCPPISKMSANGGVGILYKKRAADSAAWVDTGYSKFDLLP